MRDLNPWARRSGGRDEYRAFYAEYITSAAWYRRRVLWAEEEIALLPSGAGIVCQGCKRPWNLTRDDLHHISYERLGDEAHDDLWAMCRTCHFKLHDLLESTQSWRKLSREVANTLAVSQIMQDVEPRHFSGRLSDYL